MRCTGFCIAVLVVARSHSSAASSALRGPPSFKDQMEGLRKQLSTDAADAVKEQMKVARKDNHDHGHDRDRDHDRDHDKEHDHDNDRDHDNEDDRDRSTAEEEASPVQKSMKDQLADVPGDGLARLGKSLSAGAKAASKGGNKLADVPEDGLAHLGKSLSAGAKSASKGGNLPINQTGVASRAERPTAAAEGEAGAASAAAPLANPAEIGILVEASCRRKLKACLGMCIHGPVGQLACLAGVKEPYVVSAISAAAFAKPTIVRDRTCASLGFIEKASGPPTSQGGSKVSIYLSPGWTKILMARIAEHPPAVAAVRDGWLPNLRRASAMCDSQPDVGYTELVRRLSSPF